MSNYQFYTYLNNNVNSNVYISNDISNDIFDYIVGGTRSTQLDALMNVTDDSSDKVTDDSSENGKTFYDLFITEFKEYLNDSFELKDSLELNILEEIIRFMQKYESKIADEFRQSMDVYEHVSDILIQNCKYYLNFIGGFVYNPESYDKSVISVMISDLWNDYKTLHNELNSDNTHKGTKMDKETKINLLYIFHNLIIPTESDKNVNDPLEDNEKTKNKLKYLYDKRENNLKKIRDFGFMMDELRNTFKHDDSFETSNPDFETLYQYFVQNLNERKLEKNERLLKA